MSELEYARQLARLERRLRALETGLPRVNTSGWHSAIEETWTYASATTFTVAEDVTDRYQAGDAVRWKQGGAFLHGRIVGVTYSSPNSTVTISGDALAAATITDNYYSKAYSPQGLSPSMSVIDAWGVASSSTEISRDSSTFASAISKTVTLTKTCLVNLQFQAIAKTGTVGNPCQVQFYEGTTALGKPCDQSSTAYAPINLCWALSAAAGEHTYTVRYRRNGGSGVAYLDELVLLVTAYPL